ncbi:MAG TPA: hypothetical protein VFQ74_03360 [Pseudolysinimonas sp.]|nr:hypothetical protein [Pseudolysinimonas sp.]
MHVHLKLVLACSPDAAWRAIRSPSVFADVSYPLLEFEPLGAGHFPLEWDEGSHPVAARALFSIFDAGTQDIDIAFSERGAVRILEDHGGPLSGPLRIVTRWRHRMAVAAGPTPGTTLFRDRLEFSAGPVTPLVWLALWAFWQWRGRRLVQLSPGFERRFGTR